MQKSRIEEKLAQIGNQNHTGKQKKAEELHTKSLSLLPKEPGGRFNRRERKEFVEDAQKILFFLALLTSSR